MSSFVESVVTESAGYRAKALKSLDNLPPFSPILNRLIATLASDDVSFAEVGGLIEKDTVMSGNVLRMVNSALYGRRGEISSVRHAVSLMGLTKLRNTVMTLSMSRLWSQVRTPNGWPAARFNQHGAAAAVMTDLLAQKVPTEYPEGGFVAGLLHDIGFLLLGISNAGIFGEIRERHLFSSQPLEECEREVIGMDHAGLSAAALAQWNLPEPIQQAVHDQFAPPNRTGDEFPLSWLLQGAERLLMVREVTIFETGRPPEMAPADILEPLKLDEEWDDLLNEFEREFEPIRAFF
jgi:HD-like signal output (HDOD) protein